MTGDGVRHGPTKRVEAVGRAAVLVVLVLKALLLASHREDGEAYKMYLYPGSQ